MVFLLIPSNRLADCDSIVHLNLTVLEPDTTEIVTTICNDEDYYVGADAFDVTGIHEVLLQNQFGCDSLVMLDLTVLMPMEINLVDTICLGDTVWVGAMPYTETGTSSDTLSTFLSNCDSIVNLDLTVVDVTLDINVPDTLTCDILEIPIITNATTSLGTLNYQWTTNIGSFTTGVNGPNVGVDQPGMYYLSVDAANCTVMDSVMVAQDANLPVAIALATEPDTLTCIVESVQLDATTSMGGPNLTYQWTGNVSDPNSPTPTVTEPGIYEVLVTDLDNGCTDTDSIEIFQDTTPPVAEAGEDDTLSCLVPFIFLDGSASIPAGNISFQWEVISSGNIIPPADIPNPQVDEAGVYQLTVTNLTNGCPATDLVGVSNDNSSPIAVIEILLPDVLNCKIDTVYLDGSNSQNIQNATFEWIGNIVGGQGTTLATVTEAGDYSLVVLDSVTGCADTTTVTVLSNYNTPNADAGLGPDAISCQNTSEDIGGIGTSLGANITYQWTSSPGGALELPTDDVFAVAIAPGTYYLTVTDTVSGCSAIDSVVVDDALEPLEANVTDSLGELTCDEITFLLDGSNSILPPSGATIDWYNSAGDHISNDLVFEINYPDSFWLVLQFGECIDSALVVVEGISTVPFADAGPDKMLDCNTGEVTLDGSNSDVGINIVYQWTALGGVIVSNETTTMPEVGGVGSYELEVTDTSTACSSFDTVQVFLDSIACMPTVDAGANDTVSCSPSLINLQGSGSVGPNFSYQWIMLPDSILPDMSFNPLVGEGIYAFCVINDAVGLTACDTVEVAADTAAPIANIQDFLLALTCPELDTCYALDVSGTSQGPTITYEWASLDGNFCTPTDILNVEILGDGTYELVVTDQSNGCTDSDNIEVQLADFLYDAEIDLEDIQMDCGDTDTVITASVSPLGGDLTFEWSTFTGEIIGPANELTVTVNALTPHDVFYFTVTNNINLCTDVDSIDVFAPVNCNPECAATALGDLDCNNDTVLLSAFGSSVDTNITYLWTALTGSLCGGETTDTACADAAGIYRLTVYRTYPNGAVFDTSCDVSVEDNSDLPAVEAGPDDDLNCVDETLFLDGNGSAIGSNIIYFWETQDGSILNGETTLTPEIDAIGTYYLMATDTSTGCASIDSVEIGIDTIIPDVDAGPDQVLTCAVYSVVLDGFTSIINAEFLWTTNGGNISSDPTMEDVNVGGSGTYYLTVTNPVNGCSNVDSTLVDADDDLPKVDVGDNLDFTCADTVFTIQAVVTEPGSGALVYTWSTSDGCFSSPTDILQPTVNCPGTYVLGVEDTVTGCLSEFTLVVNDDTMPPIADAGSTAEINCNNLTLQLDGSNSSIVGQLEYLWTTSDGNILSGDSTTNPTIDSAGTYQLLVTDTTNQCKDSTTVVITIDANIPPVNAGPDTNLTCSRTELTLDGTGSATGPEFIYEWNGPGVVSNSNTLQPLIDEPGEYVLIVEDTTNFCLVTDTALVGYDTASPDANITSLQNLLVNCDIPTLTLSGSTSTPLGNVSYKWTTGNGKIENNPNNDNVTISQGGTYLLTVTDLINGCEDQETIFVEEDMDAPYVQIMPPDTLTCDSTSVQLVVLPPTNQPIYTYQWNGPGTIINDTTPTPKVSEIGVYYVTIIDTTNGCEGDSSLVVTGDTSPPTAVANSIGKLDCDNLTATVTGDGSSTGGVTYQWTTVTNGTIETPNALTSEVDAAGKYYLTVKKISNGCVDVDSTDVLANSLPIDSVMLSFQQPDCIDFEGFIFIDSVLGGTPPYTYSLNDSVFVTYPQFSFLDPGAYEFLVEDGNGCFWETIVSIEFLNDVLVDLGNDIFISQGQSADLLAQTNLDTNEISNVVWTNILDSLDCPTCLDQIVFPYETTTYHVEIFDTTGCFGTDAVTVFVDEEYPFYVPSGFTPNGDNINDLLIFYASKEFKEIPSFSIYDRWGNRVHHIEDFQPNNPYFGWDGNFQGQPMRPAVFAWKAVVEFLDGKRRVFYGDLTLVR